MLTVLLLCHQNMCICSLYNLKAFAYFFYALFIIGPFLRWQLVQRNRPSTQKHGINMQRHFEKKHGQNTTTCWPERRSLLVTTTWGEIQNIPTSSKPPGRRHTLNNARPRHLWRNLGFYDGVLVQQSATLSVSFVCNSRSRWSSGLSSSVSVEMTNWVFTPFGWYSFL